MNFLITICARGGSKGVPNKNIKLLNDTYCNVINLGEFYDQK